MLFEAGQHPAIRQDLAAGLLEALGSGPAGRCLADYFLQGTFDAGDLGAAVLGGLAAAALLSLLQGALAAETKPRKVTP